ncbi:MAG: hypothetical protein ACE5HJ_04905 [Thermoplasmata archaeon]
MSDTYVGEILRAKSDAHGRKRANVISRRGSRVLAVLPSLLLVVLVLLLPQTASAASWILIHDVIPAYPAYSSYYGEYPPSVSGSAEAYNHEWSSYSSADMHVYTYTHAWEWNGQANAKAWAGLQGPRPDYDGGKFHLSSYDTYKFAFHYVIDGDAKVVHGGCRWTGCSTAVQVIRFYAWIYNYNTGQQVASGYVTFYNPSWDGFGTTWDNAPYSFTFQANLGAGDYYYLTETYAESISGVTGWMQAEAYAHITAQHTIFRVYQLY